MGLSQPQAAVCVNARSGFSLEVRRFPSFRCLTGGAKTRCALVTHHGFLAQVHDLR
jgi:hypothetical protein